MASHILSCVLGGAAVATMLALSERGVQRMELPLVLTYHGATRVEVGADDSDAWIRMFDGAGKTVRLELKIGATGPLPDGPSVSLNDDAGQPVATLLAANSQFGAFGALYYGGIQGPVLALTGGEFSQPQLMVSKSQPWSAQNDLHTAKSEPRDSTWLDSDGIHSGKAAVR